MSFRVKFRRWLDRSALSPGMRTFLRRLLLELGEGPLLNTQNSAFRQALLRTTARGTLSEWEPDQTRPYAMRAVGWILREQQHQPDGGVTGLVSFSLGRTRRTGSYPEVTGYIIPTLFEASHLSGDRSIFDAAVKAAEFELSLQLENGAFPGGLVGELTGPSVFNSGQILHGLVRAHHETGRRDFLASAVKVADWLVSVQEPGGSWGKANYRGLRRVYDVKVAQALLELDAVVHDPRVRNAAERNVNFALANQKSNGWFTDCDNSLEKNAAPLTHTIGYTTQGLLECGKLLDREDVVRAARSALDALLHKFQLTRSLLRARYDSEWRVASSSVCVTGAAQISLCWMSLFRTLGDFGYLDAALKANDLLKQIQFRGGAMDGGLPSSLPFWGEYQPYRVNSWGVKYFADAMIEEVQIKEELLGATHQQMDREPAYIREAQHI